MYRSVNDFIKEWNYEAEATLKLFNALTEESLNKKFHEDVRTTAFLGWHITTSIAEMLNRTGLEVNGPTENDAKGTVEELIKAYKTASQSASQQVQDNWKNEDLDILVEMYGEQWPKGQVLSVLMMHQAHHRGQLSVVMRLAGLKVPGIYGPSKEEWVGFGMEPQE